MSDTDKMLFGETEDGGIDKLFKGEKKDKGMTSGHDPLKRKKLTKKQQKELQMKGHTTVTVSGDKRTLKMMDTEGGKYYYVYDRSDKPGKSIRKLSKDVRRTAEHTSADMEDKPFQGDYNY